MTARDFDPRRGAERARVATLFAILLLAACVTFATVHTAGVARGLGLAAALLWPLLLPLPGILRRRRRTFAWATLCVTPYFIYGTTEAVANPAVRTLAAAILAASLLLFCALVAWLRLTRPGRQA